jgi:hypothetical protein
MFLELKNTTFQSIASKILHFVTPLIITQTKKNIYCSERVANLLSSIIHYFRFHHLYIVLKDQFVM